ncbi:PLP-dependent aminotransferase family protein [Candidatus Symbiobacter mobilis]|uniref:Transcriptional regulator n=1 Tax=Candidatus Symbiobacter mobilis CR TaxID=946483 RepID=U5N6T8_9BURK|nr:PLP-dependent aminotransferase family protein [Candidatus Symbiobacter mobilis]AGX87097.1 transcriptional regulator [Candidatus Symbiobacter mobilis CR]
MQFADRLQGVEASAIRELFKLLGKPGIVSFAGGFPDPTLFDAEGIAQASAAVLGHDAGAVLQYGATEGYPPLRTAIADMLRSQGAEVDAADLLVTTGSQQAIELLAQTLISPGDCVLVESPTFLAAIQCFRLHGANVVGVPIDGYGVDVDRLAALLATHRPKLVYLIPSFGNPSGATLTLERRLRVLELAARTQTIVVEDDPYSALYFDAPPPASLLALSAQVPGSREWLAYCGSFSKVLSPGLRVGWLVAPREWLAKATMCKQFGDVHTSNLSQAICAQYLAMGRLPSQLERMRSSYAQRAYAMADALQTRCGAELSFLAPRGGLFFWVRCAGAMQGRAQELVRAALDHGVAMVPGAPFFANDPDPSALRLSFATSDTATIQEGVRRLAAGLHALRDADCPTDATNAADSAHGAASSPA